MIKTVIWMYPILYMLFLSGCSSGPSSRTQDNHHDDEAFARGSPDVLKDTKSVSPAAIAMLRQKERLDAIVHLLISLAEKPAPTSDDEVLLEQISIITLGQLRSDHVELLVKTLLRQSVKFDVYDNRHERVWTTIGGIAARHLSDEQLSSLVLMHGRRETEERKRSFEIIRLTVPRYDDLRRTLVAKNNEEVVNALLTSRDMYEMTILAKCLTTMGLTVPSDKILKATDAFKEPPRQRQDLQQVIEQLVAKCGDGSEHALYWDDALAARSSLELIERRLRVLALRPQPGDEKKLERVRELVLARGYPSDFNAEWIRQTDAILIRMLLMQPIAP